MKQVSRWLEGQGLGSYAGVFSTNEINGSILLELGSEDLDYMEIRPLAHRKMLLKGVEHIRQGVGSMGGGDAGPSTAASTTAASPWTAVPVSS